MPEALRVLAPGGRIVPIAQYGDALIIASATRHSPGSQPGSKTAKVETGRNTGETALKVRIFAVPTMIALTALGVGACGSGASPTATVTQTVMETEAAQPSPSAPGGTASSVPVPSPGGSATLSLGSMASGQVSKMTWTMGSHVATAPDSFQGPGFQDIAFNLTVRNDGAERIDGGGGGAQSDMVWRGTDGRTDYTLASTAATQISAGTQGITGQDLALVSGIPAKGYATGYLALVVPTSPGAIVVVDPNTNKPVLLINYDKLTSDKLNSLHDGLLADETHTA